MEGLIEAKGIKKTGSAPTDKEMAALLAKYG